ncbi:helix-turn-helix domain-containing protein [Hymenobacter rubripertinctus]|uniref:helix-turn-helix domain-containing protein n=1 Tax=Hymenobacter rubripertinctus TaxID=2029981 RepID=UPI0016039510|nr:helix-turn-helix transcriptional regulator [Hymenobacter rubripertinctus]
MSRSLRLAAVPHYLALIRDGLGLTQEQLAGALGISRHLVTKIEAGQRVLPASAGQAVLWLTQALPTGRLPAPLLLPLPPTGPLPARAGAVAYEIQRLSRQLARELVGVRRATNWLRAAPALGATLPPAAERQQLWLAATTAEAEAALATSGSPARQQLLEARLAGLRAEAAALAAYLNP